MSKKSDPGLKSPFKKVTLTQPKKYMDIPAPSSPAGGQRRSLIDTSKNPLNDFANRSSPASFASPGSKKSRSNSKNKSKNAKKDEDEISVKSDMLEQLDRDVEKMSKIFKSIDHLLEMDPNKQSLNEQSLNSNSPIRKVNVRNSIIPTKQISLD